MALLALCVLELHVPTLIPFLVLSAAVKVNQNHLLHPGKNKFHGSSRYIFAKFTTINQAKPNMNRANFPKLNVKPAVYPVHP